MKKIILLAITVAMTMVFGLIMAGCGSDENDFEAEVIGSCSIEIQDQLEATTFELLKDETVFDILNRTGIAMSAEDTGNGMAVEAIGGVANGDKGKTSGWMFTVNGDIPMDYADKVKVKDGDEIVWTFEERM